MPQITVIVPVYKVENYLEKCVESILSQSFGDFDLVLVDDGSPDACPQMCDAFAEKDDRIVVIHKKNGGLSDARNAGIDWAMEHSNSQWLAFVDSDDYLHPDYLKRLYDTARKEKADLVVCDYIRFSDAGEWIKEEDDIIEPFVTEDSKELFEYFYSSWRIRPAWNKLYHKHIFDELRFAFGKIHEDEYAIHHILWNCKRAVVIPDDLYYYRVRESSIMACENQKSLLDRLEALIEQYEFGLKNQLLPFGIGTTTEYLEYVLRLGVDLDRNNLQRYHALLHRYAGVYFGRDTNRTPKRIIIFCFCCLRQQLRRIGWLAHKVIKTKEG